MILLILLLIVSALCLWTAGKILRNASGPRPAGSAGDSRAAGKQIDDLARSISLFVSELHEASDEILRRLDDREQSLRQVMQEAQGLIVRLEELRRPDTDAFAQVQAGEPPVRQISYGQGLEQRYREIFSLYDQGVSIADIARTMGMEKGQVELIFNLRRKM